MLKSSRRKTISSFVRDPCEPAEANDKDTYEIDPQAQYQIVHNETRRECQGTRCEKYISQFTYYCGTADHSSSYPQKTFYRRPMVMVWDECTDLASLGRYIAGDSKTYKVLLEHTNRSSILRSDSATAYTRFEGNPITCSGDTLMVDGKEIYNMVMHVTEEVLYRKEKFVSRDDR